MHLNAKECEQFFCDQVGGGGNFFHGQTAYQRGYGFFGDVRRFITPFALRAGKYLGKQLLNTGRGVIEDVTSGSSLRDATRSRLRQTSKRMKEDILHRLQHGQGIKRKSTRKTNQTRKKRRKTTSRDIFT